MARNEEKAQSMLYRFRKAMQHADSDGWRNARRLGGGRGGGDGGGSLLSSLLPSSCRSVQAALHARRELMKDLSRKITRIQDPELDEAAIRALNDELNRLVRLRKQWDETLRTLGYKERERAIRWGPESLPESGITHGYLYFGRARELPGVQELLNPRKELPTKMPARLLAMQEAADAEYFGVLAPEEEAELRESEAKAERQCLGDGEHALADWITGLPVVLPVVRDGEQPDVSEAPSVPTMAQVEAFLIEKRRQDLLKRYASSS